MSEKRSPAAHRRPLGCRRQEPRYVRCVVAAVVVVAGGGGDGGAALGTALDPVEDGSQRC